MARLFDLVPDKGFTRKEKARVKRSVFGDGYSARVGDGLNSVYEELTLEFTLRSAAEVAIGRDFLRDHAGVTAFNFALPGEPTLLYTCDEWDSNKDHDGNAMLKAVFKQEFES